VSNNGANVPMEVTADASTAILPGALVSVSGTEDQAGVPVLRFGGEQLSLSIADNVSEAVDDDNDNDAVVMNFVAAGSDGKPPKCSTCRRQMESRSKSDYRLHHSWHQRGYKRAACPACEVPLLDIERLIQHLQLYHKPLSSYQCEKCLVRFDGVENFVRHLREVRVDTYQCKKCPTVFFSDRIQCYEHQRCVHNTSLDLKMLLTVDDLTCPSLLSTESSCLAAVNVAPSLAGTVCTPPAAIAASGSDEGVLSGSLTEETALTEPGEAIPSSPTADPSAKEKSLTCKVCNFVAKSLKALRAHSMEGHKVKACRECPFHTTSSSTIYEHRQMHAKMQKLNTYYKCTTCHHILETVNGARLHYSKTHGKTSRDTMNQLIVQVANG
jgi:hypothetical protein